jgi:hypothetical protein
LGYSGRREFHILGDQIDEKERLVLPCIAMALKNKLLYPERMLEKSKKTYKLLIRLIGYF